MTSQRRGRALGCPVAGYQIHHGRTAGSRPWLTLDGADEGSATADGVFGTSLHGLFESDSFRASFLQLVSQRAAKSWTPTGLRFAELRARRADRLADLLDAHLDLAAVDAMISAT